MDNYYIRYLNYVKNSDKKVKSISHCNNTEEFKDYLRNSLTQKREYDFETKTHCDNCLKKSSQPKKSDIEKIQINLKTVKTVLNDCEKILEAIKEYNNNIETINRNSDLDTEIKNHNICCENAVKNKKLLD